MITLIYSISLNKKKILYKNRSFNTLLKNIKRIKLMIFIYDFLCKLYLLFEIKLILIFNFKILTLMKL